MESSTNSIAIKSIHSTLDPGQLFEKLNAQFDFPKSSHCKYFFRGSNDIYKIYTPEEDYFLRLSNHGTRTEQEILDEIEFLNHWQQTSVGVAQPIPNKNGTYVLPVEAAEGTRFLTLFQEAKGQSLATPSPAQLRKIGIELGKLHLRSNRFPLKPNFPFYDLNYCLTQSSRNICVFLRQRSEIREHCLAFQSLSLDIKKRLSKFPLESFSWGPIHGDFIHGNFKMNSEGEISVYDFERIGYGWRAYEIASYI